MNIDDINAMASRVILTEADALHQMANDLPNDFTSVVEAILATKGRVIVSGVGKSGHIGNKIAATLASTGTPASFVHATEASHGDLGMVTSADFCLLISNSGETSELHDIVAHTRRFGIPMAAISSNPNSTLMQAADYKLTLTQAPEACSIGMAPTTSTTLTLALGDALGITLMKLRDFQPEDFRVFHPGGKLGAKIHTVKQLMRPISEMAILKSDCTMKEVILLMTKTGYGLAVLVNKDECIVGVISDGDLRRHAENLLGQEPISMVTASPVTVAPNDLVVSAINKMETNKVYSILVIDDAKPVGLLRMHDLLHAGIT
ncbi:KpsF/GutQ family sugar-phosphate isomerase [Amylibacter sp.]|jgi:arabinose-5-phosphate isomerase|nr:KpsF/GutQ family sugar-phosphate isomerase [Amylibacter sp.]